MNLLAIKNINLNPELFRFEGYIKNFILKISRV